MKTDFSSQQIIDLPKPVFLPITEMSLLIETTDERRTGQARPMQSPMLALLDELHCVFFVIMLKDL